MRSKFWFILPILYCLSIPLKAFTPLLFEVDTGVVHFYSNAPKELIHAYTTELKGLVDFSEKTFLFRVSIPSFEGFNSPLQREHFNENYLESEKYPEATFSGKIIEDISMTSPGTYSIRAKGKLNIHGISVERIIRVTLKIQPERVWVEAEFPVMLKDHQIKIPRVVDNKLSPEIKVSVEASLRKK